MTREERLSAAVAVLSRQVDEDADLLLVLAGEEEDEELATELRACSRKMKAVAAGGRRLVDV